MLLSGEAASGAVDRTYWSQLCHEEESEAESSEDSSKEASYSLEEVANEWLRNLVGVSRSSDGRKLRCYASIRTSRRLDQTSSISSAAGRAQQEGTVTCFRVDICCSYGCMVRSARRA